MFLSRGDRDLGAAFQTHPGRQAFISSGSKEPHSALESPVISHHPYLIKDDVKTVYLNVSKIESVNEAEIDVLSREEYDARLKEVVAEKCVDCEYYTEDTKGDNLKGHREKLSLDGECRYYKKKSE